VRELSEYRRRNNMAMYYFLCSKALPEIFEK
jgi:hypothetical protein